MTDTKIGRDHATRLLALSRQAKWAFPSSAGRPLPPGDRPDWLDRLVAERGSLLPAARFFRDVGDDGDAVELAAKAWRLWIVTRELTTGRTFVAAAVDGYEKATAARALALYGDGLLALSQGSLAESRERSEDALQAATACGDIEALALAHLGVARVAFEDGDYERARTLAIDARRYAERLTPAHGQAPLHARAGDTPAGGARRGSLAVRAEPRAQPAHWRFGHGRRRASQPRPRRNPSRQRRCGRSLFRRTRAAPDLERPVQHRDGTAQPIRRRLGRGRPAGCANAGRRR